MSNESNKNPLTEKELKLAFDGYFDSYILSISLDIINCAYAKQAPFIDGKIPSQEEAKKIAIDLAIKENRYNYFLKCYKDVLESLPKMKQKEVLKVYSQMITMREVQDSGDAVLNHVLFPPANKEVN